MLWFYSVSYKVADLRIVDGLVDPVPVWFASRLKFSCGYAYWPTDLAPAAGLTCFSLISVSTAGGSLN
ncbi:MAG: hypothetical protein AAFP03_11560 [Cyanobacteria bacterium J06598_3]